MAPRRPICDGLHGVFGVFGASRRSRRALDRFWPGRRCGGRWPGGRVALVVGNLRVGVSSSAPHWRCHDIACIAVGVCALLCIRVRLRPERARARSRRCRVLGARARGCVGSRRRRCCCSRRRCRAPFVVVLFVFVAYVDVSGCCSSAAGFLDVAWVFVVASSQLGGWCRDDEPRDVFARVGS